MSTKSYHGFKQLVEETFPEDNRVIFENVHSACVILASVNAFEDISVSPEIHDLANEVYETMSDFKELNVELKNVFVDTIIQIASLESNKVGYKEKYQKFTNFLEKLYVGLIDDIMESDVEA